MKRLFLLIFIGGGFLGKAQGQTNAPLAIGSKFPDFELNNILYYRDKSVKVSDFKGQYVILDFFNENCTACVASWPHTNDIQKRYQGQLQIMLVGASLPHGAKVLGGKSKAEQIESMKQIYTRFRKTLHLELPVALSTQAYEQLGIYAGPKLVWIDKSGIVQAIGLPAELNDHNLKIFLSGKPVRLIDDFSDEGRSLAQKNLNAFLAHFYQLDTALQVQSRSVLSKWRPGLPNEGNFPRLSYSEGKLEVIGSDITRLYLYAYFGFTRNDLHDPEYGKHYFAPIFSVKDTAIFKTDCNHITEETQKYLYNYSLRMPEIGFTEKKGRQWLRSDLDRYLGYETHIEKRMMPYWRLVLSDKIKHKFIVQDTVTEFSYTEPVPHAGFIATMPMSFAKPGDWPGIVGELAKANKSEIPIIDETGIKGIVTLKITANLLDFDDLRRAYHEQGLDLVKGYKMMDVLVIRDAEPEKK